MGLTFVNVTRLTATLKLPKLINIASKCKSKCFTLETGFKQRLLEYYESKSSFEIPINSS